MNVIDHPAFEPPAPHPVQRPLSLFALARTLQKNPLEIWGPMGFNDPYVEAKFMGLPVTVVNEPDYIKHIMIDNQKNYVMAPLRQAVLRPILRDGLLTIEGHGWKRSRKAMSPMFTPRHIKGFAYSMLEEAEAFSKTYQGKKKTDISSDMTLLTYNILENTLFSGEVAGEKSEFEGRINKLLDTMGRPDPLDVFKMPEWLPRVTHWRGKGVLNYFRKAVRETADLRRAKIAKTPHDVPEDFLTLLLGMEGPDGLSADEVDDNLITFIGAGHETTARALGWTLYLLAKAPDHLAIVEEEIDRVLPTLKDPNDWLDALPKTRAAFEEAMRLYPPAPTLSRQAVQDDVMGDLHLEAGTEVLIMPWTLHRHNAYWDEPRLFKPQRFWPENRDKIRRFQYLPFGAGPRICIGQSFAMIEGVVALAVLLRDWRFIATDACQPWPVQKLTIQPEGGLPMYVSPR